MSDWISVHDVNIPKDTCIDVWMDYGDYTGRICNCFLGDDENSMWKWNENCDGKVTFPAYGITHWMPLPEPPKTQQ